MITKVELQNFMSFGARQAVSLQGITVLVGANNSGKSNFLRFPSFFQAQAKQGVDQRMGRFDDDFRRPARDPSEPLVLEWEVNGPDGLRYTLEVQRVGLLGGWKSLESCRVSGQELYRGHGGVIAAGTPAPGGAIFQGYTFGGAQWGGVAVDSLRHRDGANPPGWPARLVDPVMSARRVHLSLEALRNDGVPGNVELEESGNGLAATVATWRGNDPDAAEEYDRLVSTMIPELKRVLVTFVDGKARLCFEQKDGEFFDAHQVSDGVVTFAGLIAQALEAPANGLVLLEEPERCIHPARLEAFVDVLRRLVVDRKIQFILATHSPKLLSLFRDEPESIQTFVRGKNGTVVRCLADRADLRETLERAHPGDLLADGVFNSEEL